MQCPANLLDGERLAQDLVDHGAEAAEGVLERGEQPQAVDHLHGPGLGLHLLQLAGRAGPDKDRTEAGYNVTSSSPAPVPPVLQLGQAGVHVVALVPGGRGPHLLRHPGRGEQRPGVIGLPPELAEW